MQLGLRHVQAYLLLLPAFVFLVGFTHYPAIGTLIDSLMSTPRAGRAAVFVGLELCRHDRRPYLLEVVA